MPRHPVPATGVLPPPTPLTFDDLAEAYLEDYALQRYRSLNTAKGRVAHLRRTFGGRGWGPSPPTPSGSINCGAAAKPPRPPPSTGRPPRSGRMLRLAASRAQIDRPPVFPNRLDENPPREGFFEHEEYLRVRAELPPSYQDVLDFAYYSGWRKNEILGLTWTDVDVPAGVVRLTARRSKTKTGRMLPISPPLRAVLQRRLAQRTGPGVFTRDGVPVRGWRTALRDGCRRAGVPHRVLHDCRRTAARNLIRAGVPERVAMLLTGHKTRAIFDRYNIVNERELLQAGERLADYLHPPDRA